MIDNLLIPPIEFLEIHDVAVRAQISNRIDRHALEDVAPVAAKLDEGTAEIEDHTLIVIG